MANVVLSRITMAIATVLGSLLTLYWWIVFIAVLLTWVNPDPYNPIVRFLRSVTEPVFYWIRRRMPFVVVGGWDLSPIVVMIGIMVLQMVVVDSLRQFAYRLDLTAALGVLTG
jgi:YggT family protein